MSKGKKIIVSIIALITIVLIVIIGFFVSNLSQRARDIPSGTVATPSATPSAKVDVPAVSQIAKKLQIPWSLAFLPDGDIILTERPGRIRFVDAENGLLDEPILTIADVHASGEGGLLGITPHPEFKKNSLLYVYYTYKDGAQTFNKVVQYRLQNKSLIFQKIIIDRIPGSGNHNGGRIKFGPDGFLYITTGDAGLKELAQDKTSLAGKILRLKDDGSVPAGNPFGNAVFSFGHRNPQGLAWDSDGRLWSTEHGSSGLDELNLIEKGKNYGWPTISGDQGSPGMEKPIIHSGGAQTWAPSGAAFYKGSIFFAGLRGRTLYEAKINGEKVTLKKHLVKKFGRLRDVVVGPDDLLYSLTSNRDGRGIPTGDDDQLIRINPEKL